MVGLCFVVHKRDSDKKKKLKKLGISQVASSTYFTQRASNNYLDLFNLRE